MDQIKISGKNPSFSDLSKTKIYKSPKQFCFTNLILSIIETLRKTIYTFRFFFNRKHSLVLRYALCYSEANLLKCQITTNNVFSSQKSTPIRTLNRT